MVVLLSSDPTVSITLAPVDAPMASTSSRSRPLGPLARARTARARGYEALSPVGSPDFDAASPASGPAPECGRRCPATQPISLSAVDEADRALTHLAVRALKPDREVGLGQVSTRAAASPVPKRPHSAPQGRVGPVEQEWAVAKRATAHYYTAANAERASAGLILTGRAAAEGLSSALLEDHRHVCGYVPSGTVDEYASSHFMVETPTGRDVLYENTLPIAYPGTIMPSAVVAADLATSTDARERSAGLQALEELRQRWLADH